MSDSPADVLATALAAGGSTVAFGVPGGGPNLEVIEAFDRNGIRFVLAHSETAACIMASVTGHLTGRLAAAVVTRGPGAASAVNGAAQATLDRHPLVLVADTVPAVSAGRVPHQRLDQRAMLGPACKLTATLGAGVDPTELAELLAVATNSPAGAVHLDYDASSTGLDRDAGPAPVATGRPSAAELDRATRLVAGSRRPIVIVGTGCGRRELLPALEAFGAPVLTTYQAIGTIPTEHRLAAGLFTNGASEAPLLARSDLIVAIGLDPVEPIPAPWAVGAPVLALSPGPTVDAYLPIEVELVGDPAELAATLLADPPPSAWPPTAGADHRETVRAALAADRAAGGDGLDPVELVEVAAAATPPSTVVTVDAGAHFLAIMPFWPVAGPRQLLISNGLATMGYALPAAIAAAVAAPDRPVLCLVGDGGLSMTLAELETAARLDLPITVVVFNDSALSLIRIKQRTGQGGDSAVAYRPTDFAAAAASLGVPGVAVDTPEALHAALAARPSGPRLIDATVDPSHYPRLLAVTRG